MITIRIFYLGNSCILLRFIFERKRNNILTEHGKEGRENTIAKNKL